MVLALSFSAFAQQNEPAEKIVTTKLSYKVGSAAICDHYFSNQEYTSNAVMGFAAEFGSFYKKNENLSWKLDLTYFGIGKTPTNPAGSAKLSIYDGEIEYSTSYNWNPVKNLHLRAGGAFNLNGGLNFAPDGINNVMQYIIQPQIKAVAGIKYGWNFKKMGLNLYADLGLPVMGFATVGSRHEGSFVMLNGAIPFHFLVPTIDHMVFTSFHNLQGYDLDLGLDLQFRTFSLVMSVETNNKWWHAYDSMAYKKYVTFNIGFCMDLVSRPRSITHNRYF